MLTAMKKMVLLLMFAGLLCNINVRAQESGNYPKGYIGFRYMPTFTSFKVNENNGVAETRFTLGHGFAGIVGGNFGHHVGMQAEVIYNQLTQTVVQNNVERKVDLKYVNIPLLLVLNSDVASVVNFNITAGPQLGI